MNTLLWSIIILNLLVPLGSSYPTDTSFEHGIQKRKITTNCTCGWANRDLSRIVGGKMVEVNEYPLMAGLVNVDDKQIKCGGTIITPRHIITAAHCTDTFHPMHYGIFVGYYNYEAVKNHTKLLEPKKFYIHKKYDNFYVIYDISIILMKTEIKFNRVIGPVCLPTAKTPLEGKLVKLLGWGRTKSANSSDELLEVNLHVQPFGNCSSNHTKVDKNNVHQFCTYSEGKDSCEGDSGGPVLWVDPQTNRYTLVGITSYGLTCGKYSAVNTDIGHFLPWIHYIISRSDSKMKTCSKKAKQTISAAKFTQKLSR